MYEDQSEDSARFWKERCASCSSIKEGRQRQQSEEDVLLWREREREQERMGEEVREAEVAG